MTRTLLILLSSSAMLAACANSPNTARGAAGGALAGAAVGAVVGNNTGSGDAQSGALAGAAAGAAIGAAAGCQRDGTCPWSRDSEHHSELYYDERAGRRYFINHSNGCSYWQNGDPRSC